MSFLKALSEQNSIKTKVSYVLHSKIPMVIFFLIGPFFMYALVEILNNNRPFAYFSTLQVSLNLFWYFLVYFLCYLVSGRMKLASGIAASIFFILGNINHYVYSFRGRTIFPGDILSLRTAANVSAGYDYTPDNTQIIVFFVFLAYIAILLALPWKKDTKRPKIIVTAAVGVVAAVYFVVFFQTNFLANSGIEPSMWTTRGNGLILNFCVSLRYSVGEEPDGYSENNAKKIAESVPDASTDEENPVNVIVIMGESFADLEVLGRLPVNEPVMPYYRSLSENCIKGWAYSSVFGGTTANSEYEFLTGNTMHFLPDDTVPYQLYVDERSTSIVGQMNTLGYRTVAMHPYLKSGWNRIPVYANYGFDEVYFKDDFTKRKYMRNYITDQCNYENVVRVFEEKEEGEKLFIFNITMQNHSAYNVEYKGLPDLIRLQEPMDDVFPRIDQFLSLMKQSDLALEWLIDYFSSVDEKTVILLFGDHQPQVEKEFYELMLGGNLETRHYAALQYRQMVPYCLWANYDIDGGDGKSLSLNFLGPLLMETAGLKMTGYQSFLHKVSQKLPVINTLGFMTETGVNYETVDELPEDYKSIVYEYQILQYNEIFGKDTKLDNFFELAG